MNWSADEQIELKLLTFYNAYNCRKKNVTDLSADLISQSYFVFHERKKKQVQGTEETSVDERYLSSDESFGERFCHNR